MSPLLQTLVHRLIASLMVLVGVSMLMFAIARMIPGDPARIALGPNATEAQVQALRHERHLDQPIPAQYWFYVRELAHGDLGNSLYSNRPVRRRHRPISAGDARTRPHRRPDDDADRHSGRRRLRPLSRPLRATISAGSARS